MFTKCLYCYKYLIYLYEKFSEYAEKHDGYEYKKKPILDGSKHMLTDYLNDLVQAQRKEPFKNETFMAIVRRFGIKPYDTSKGRRMLYQDVLASGYRTILKNKT